MSFYQTAAKGQVEIMIKKEGNIKIYRSIKEGGAGERCGIAECKNGRTKLNSVAILFALCLLIFAGVLSSDASATIINESMLNDTAPNWVIGGSAYLTASTGLDPVGSGWLRITSVANDQAGFAFLDSAFDVSSGVVIQFDYATWGGAGTGSTCGATGADGYSVYLFDGAFNASTFVVGASGGSLGYDKKTVNPIHAGLTGGYLGVGIDEWGNFSMNTEGRTGGPGVMKCNGVAVRGPSTLALPYNYIGGTTNPIGALAFPGYAARPNQTGADYRKVVIYMTPVGSNPVTDMRIDVYMQLGYTSALTQVLSGLMLGSGPPNNGMLKIGYAASTGGSTNYHEIRNLVIDPLPAQNIDLGITKVASTPTPTANGPLTYTVTVRNYGPSNVTASNVPITDSVPAQLTGVTWTCGGTGGAVCSATTGTGNNINTSVTLPLNSFATYTISGIVSAPAGTQFTNTATLTVPSGINDYNSNNDSASAAVSVTAAPVTVTGRVCNDANHDGCAAGEAGANVAAVYAKLFRSSDLSTALTVTAVAASVGTGPTFTFSNVPSYDTYTIILSSTATTVYDPSFPSGNWIYTTPLNYVLSGVYVGGTNLTNQNFGVLNGSRIDGKVIKDNGFNGALANANDGVLNAAETGISGVTMKIALNSNPTGTVDTTTTDSGGNFSLFTGNTVTSQQLRIYEVNSSIISVSSNAGNTAGAYTLAADYISFAYTLYTDYSGILFGDVPDNTFAANQANNGMPSNTVYYPHTFTPGSGGTVTFAQNSRTRGTWPAVAYYRDTNGNGVYDSGVDTLISGAVTASANVPIYILTAVSVLATAPTGTTDVLVTRATFSFTNSVRPATSTYDVTDTTTVISAPNLSTSTKSVVDQNGGSALPNDVLRYTISVKETAGVAANGVTITDNIPANVTGFTVVSFSSGTNSSTGAGTGSNGTGYLNITNFSLASNGTATIVFDVTIANGTPPGTVINNSASVTPPAGLPGTPAAPPVTVGPFVNITGMIYSDANHNGANNSEASTNVAGIYAKLFYASDLTTALSVTPVVQSSGTYTFTNVPGSNTYVIILSNTGSNAYNPSFPSSNWVYMTPANFILSNVVVAGSNLVNQDFGLYNGSRIAGKVMQDDGAGVGFGNANNGIQNASEPGISGVQVKIAVNSAPTGTLDIATTDSNGVFTLYTTNTTTALRIVEVSNPAGYVSVNFNAGNTNGAYTPANDYILFNNYTLYTDYSGVIFSDVPDNTFTPTSQALNGTPSSTVYYAHSFTPGSGGSVLFSQSTRTTTPAAPAWPAVVYYQDNNCSGTYDGGDTVLSGAINTTRGTAICILAGVAAASGAADNTTDALTTRAAFTYTNSVGPVVRNYDVTDTTTITASDLSTSTKTWIDSNGGDQDPNDVLQYTISIIESAGNAASGVTATDTFPAALTNLSVVTCPVGATCNFAGQTLTVSNVSVGASGTASVVISSTIVGGTSAGTLIDNCATITNPAGPGAAPCAGTVTVSATSVPITGNKPLYLYSSPTRTLSRTPPIGTPTQVALASSATLTWTLLPVAAGTITLSSAVSSTVSVPLYMTRDTAGTERATVTLRCSSGGPVLSKALINVVTLNAEPGAPVLVQFDLPLSGTLSCTAGNSLLLGITNNSGTRILYIYPVSGGNYSRAVLPVTTVINVDSVKAYTATYPSTSTPAAGHYIAGQTVYLRSVVSDPFGSYDIASSATTTPKITIKDANNNFLSPPVTNVSMTYLSSATTTSTKTFEYVYTPVPATGPTGTWTMTVTAQEGTEGTVSDTGVGTFKVQLFPSIVIVKSVQTYSDPVNGIDAAFGGPGSAKAIPGAIMLYTILVTNTGAGATDSDSVKITDPIPANTSLCVSTLCNTPPVAFSCSGTPACGLTYNYAADVTYFDQSNNSIATPSPDSEGYDALVRKVIVNPKGVFNGAGGSNPNFNVYFKVKVQ